MAASGLSPADTPVLSGAALVAVAGESGVEPASAATSTPRGAAGGAAAAEAGAEASADLAARRPTTSRLPDAARPGLASVAPTGDALEAAGAAAAWAGDADFDGDALAGGDVTPLRLVKT
mmetsp:Transcript_4188/g.17721  ORF Transcript_4188/g.17721 Transcript_4188/m.17721 type:complete len:120 (-) Transcript_4188:2157-2516(-)